MYITSTVKDMELEIEILNDLRSLLPATLPARLSACPPACLPIYLSVYLTISSCGHKQCPTSFLFSHFTSESFLCRVIHHGLCFKDLAIRKFT